MSTPLLAPGTAPGPASAPQLIAPHRYDWLAAEVAGWQADGTVTDEQASAILGRYHASRRFSLASLILTLGGAFVAVGLVWLVAANLDELSPLVRFLVVAALWVAVTVAAEVLAGLRVHGGPVPSPLVAVARMLAAAALGAVIFQAAQSLQVPAYEPKLVGLWALGALLYAYVVKSPAAHVIGLATTVVWFVWQVAWDHPVALDLILAFSVIAMAGVAMAVLHERWWPDVAASWREVGALFGLVALFAAALPFVDAEDFRWTLPLSVAVALTAVAVVGAMALARGWARWEILGMLVLAGLALLLTWWDTGLEPDQFGSRDLTGADVAHAAVAVVVYVVAAAGVAALGILHDSWRLTLLATGALVVFVTFQSFAVFAQIITGAWLFLVLGTVFLLTGYAADRARRQLARSIDAVEESNVGEADAPEGAES
ncbi:MAG: DUF2157 domain-containing protein [Nocardioides sp.]